ncbi:hypothetical protein PQR34_48525 [Paraburkholderia sediminicola]|uniref:hypothetical protein n=1 Tax=Paraburkholderia sediminicola TaxID=458836 RepID=UPI0038BABA15
MRSVETGSDLGDLTRELWERHGLARDQNGNATVTRGRRDRLGIPRGDLDG